MVFYICMSDYEDTATNLKSARSRVYHLVKLNPMERVYVYDADPETLISAGDVIRHRRGWGWMTNGQIYWCNVRECYLLRYDGTIKR